MFAEIELEWTVVVQPDAMKSSSHIQRAVIMALLKDFNDVKCTAQHGYYVALTALENIGEGRLWERRGCAAFPVRFRCVVFNVIQYEHVLAIVTDPQAAGISCQCGPLEQLFISQKYLKEYEFMSTEVETLLVPKWRNVTSGATIQKGDVIRVKVLGTKWEPAQRSMSAVGSLLGSYTGVDKRWPAKNATSKSNAAGGGLRQEAGGLGDGDPWGEQTANEDNSGWGEPIATENNSGWGEPLANEGNDAPAPSGWD